MQNQDQFSQQTIVVKDGVGRPKNPNKFIDLSDRKNYKAYTSKDAFDKNKVYIDFEQYVKDNSFSTDAVDGEYPASCFGYEVWQYTNDFVIDWTDAPIVRYDEYSTFNEYRDESTDHETQCRCYRPFIANNQPTAPTTTEGGLSGVDLISKERSEQIHKHGMDLQRDVELNSDEQLAQAAIFVLTQDPDDYPKDWDLWFYDAVRLKGDTKEADIEKLAIAGALIAAEIDRLNGYTHPQVEQTEQQPTCSNCGIKLWHKRELQDGNTCKPCFEKLSAEHPPVSNERLQGETVRTESEIQLMLNKLNQSGSNSRQAEKVLFAKIEALQWVLNKRKTL